MNFNKMLIQDVVSRREQSQQQGGGGGGSAGVQDASLGMMQCGVASDDYASSSTSFSRSSSCCISCCSERAECYHQSLASLPAHTQLTHAQLTQHKQNEEAEEQQQNPHTAGFSSRAGSRELLLRTIRDLTRTISSVKTRHAHSRMTQHPHAHTHLRTPRRPHLHHVAHTHAHTEKRNSQSHTQTHAHTHRRRLQSRATKESVVALKDFLFEDERLSKLQSKMVVEIRVVFLKIGEIDTLKEIYHADVFIQAKWKEAKLFGKTQEDLKHVDLQRRWNPLLYIDNILNESKDKYWLSTELTDTNEVVIIERRKLKGVFLETLELNDFPLDVQDLTITITSERPDTEVDLVPDNSELSCINIQTFVDQQEWMLHEHIEVSKRSVTQEYSSSNRSHACLSVTCRASRRPGYFYWNVFLIMFFITGLSFATFSLQPDRPENRLQLSFTLFLTSVAFKFVINQSLPKISYLTYMDKYVLMSLAILCLVSIWHATVTLILPSAAANRSNSPAFSSRVPSTNVSIAKMSQKLYSANMSAFNFSTKNSKQMRNSGKLPTQSLEVEIKRRIMQSVNKNKSLSNNFSESHTFARFSVYKPTILFPAQKQPNNSSKKTSNAFKSPILSFLSLFKDGKSVKSYKQAATFKKLSFAQRRLLLQKRVEYHVVICFAVIYGLAHLLFCLWLYFDASKRRREMLEKDRQYKEKINCKI